MRLTYLGHAGFIFESGNIRVLVDPWFFPGFLQSWFPYPDNRFLLSSVLNEKFDFLYVSHLHEDHFDRKLLAELDKSVTVFCPQYRSRGVGRKLASLGFRNLIPLSHKQSFRISNDMTATMFLDTSHKEDSGLLLDCGDFRFLDLNDCNTSFTELPNKIDLLAAQYSGAMWYPNCYDYPPDTMREKVQKVRSDLMDSLVRKTRATNAKYYVPSAGPACFLDPALMEFNDRDSTIFPIWEDVEKSFAGACPDTSVIRLHPGDALDLPEFRVEHRDSRHESSVLEEYSERRREEWGQFYAGGEPEISVEDIRKYFDQLQRRNDHLAKNLQKYIRISADGRSWGIRLGEMAEDFVIEGEDPYPPEYLLVLPPRVLRAILEREVGWEEALLSMRVKLSRIPDVFDSRLMGLLRYGNEPIQTLQMTKEADQEEFIERDGLRLQRFCPHAGEDLTNAIICQGLIECPRHHWKWDAETGACIDGGNIPLRLEHLRTKTLS